LKKQPQETHLSNKYLRDKRKHNSKNKDKFQKTQTRDDDLKKISIFFF